MTKRLAGLLCSVAIVSVAASVQMPPTARHQDLRAPILVELFTSEGCSSCPPADAFLARLDRLQPVPGAELIVLSEHVDYLDHIGWKDRYSGRLFSDRQRVYAQRFGRDSVYTPQIVVDGSAELVGSDGRLADRAFVAALKASKVGIRLSSIASDTANGIQAHVEADRRLDSSNAEAADIYLAVVISHAESNVARGENAGRRLAHTNVVISLTKIGSVSPGRGFAKDVRAKLEPGLDARNLRLIAFIQERQEGRVLGATQQAVSQAN